MLFQHTVWQSMSAAFFSCRSAAACAVFPHFAAAWSTFIWRSFLMCELCSNTVFLLLPRYFIILPLARSPHSFPLSSLSPLHLLWVHVEKSVFCERSPRSFPDQVGDGNVGPVLCSRRSMNHLFSFLYLKRCAHPFKLSFVVILPITRMKPSALLKSCLCPPRRLLCRCQRHKSSGWMFGDYAPSDLPAF